MEIEKEKRKIEFWSSSDDILQAMHNNRKGIKPLTGAVEVSVKICDKDGIYKGLAMSDIVSRIEDSLQFFGYIRSFIYIRTITVDIISGKTKSIAFFMQEVE